MQRNTTHPRQSFLKKNEPPQAGHVHNIYMYIQYTLKTRIDKTTERQSNLTNRPVRPVPPPLLLPHPPHQEPHHSPHLSLVLAAVE